MICFYQFFTTKITFLFFLLLFFFLPQNYIPYLLLICTNFSKLNTTLFHRKISWNNYLGNLFCVAFLFALLMALFVWKLLWKASNDGFISFFKCTLKYQLLCPCFIGINCRDDYRALFNEKEGRETRYLQIFRRFFFCLILLRLKMHFKSHNHVIHIIQEQI